MRICIFGAGAIGGYLAARLARAGRDVSLVARGPHLQAIRANGLTLETPQERFTVNPRASDDPAKLGPQDLVVITAKTPALPEVARRIEPLLGPDTPVVFGVNGVFWFYGDGFAPGGVALDTSRLDPDGLLARHIGRGRALGMVIYSPNEVIAPGMVRNRRTHGNRFVLGEPVADPSGKRLARIVAMLDGCGFAVEASPDIRLEMWKKLARNVSGSPLCALTGADGGTLVADDDLRRLSAELMRETLAVAAAHGFTDLGADPEELRQHRSSTGHKPSMLQDMERGRPIEFDSMLGILRDFARQANVPTPVLDIVAPLLAMRAKVAGCY
jgi:2-dehydropantoate 2-reductase